MAEAFDEATLVRLHPKKIAFQYYRALDRLPASTVADICSNAEQFLNVLS